MTRIRNNFNPNDSDINSYTEVGSGRKVSLGAGGQVRDYDLSLSTPDKVGITTRNNSFEREKKRNNEDNRRRYGNVVGIEPIDKKEQSNTVNLDRAARKTSNETVANQFRTIIQQEIGRVASLR